MNGWAIAAIVVGSMFCGGVVAGGAIVAYIAMRGWR